MAGQEGYILSGYLTTHPVCQAGWDRKRDNAPSLAAHPHTRHCINSKLCAGRSLHLDVIPGQGGGPQSDHLQLAQH
jgi:hypothetical protein